MSQATLFGRFAHRLGRVGRGESRSGEGDVGGRLDAAGPAGGVGEAPVQVGVGRLASAGPIGPPHSRDVLGGVSVGNQCGVVSTGERTVQGRADAGVGLRAGDDDAADARARRGWSRGRCPRTSRRSACGRGARRRRGWSSSMYSHGSEPATRSSSACWTQMTGTASARARSTRVLMLSITRSTSNASPTTPRCMSITMSAVFGRS